MRPAAAIAFALTPLACQAPPEPVPRAYLFEKGQYQALYGPDGRMRRLLYDGNGDRRADVVMIYGSNLKPSQVEIDDDLDGAVDRWESYDRRGRLVKVARARRVPGEPDAWESIGATGAVERQDLDEDGDGRVDRTEYFRDRHLARVDVDADRDGRIDRWQDWKDGILLDETIDTDGDGKADRRLVHGAGGVRLETLGRP
jgi:hypothetical protein